MGKEKSTCDLTLRAFSNRTSSAAEVEKSKVVTWCCFPVGWGRMEVGCFRQKFQVPKMEVIP